MSMPPPVGTLESTEWTPRPFHPAWWLPGPHLQTMAGKFLRTKAVPGLTRERVPTPDGDFLDLDWMPELDPSAPIALVLHGLEGHTRRGYVLEAFLALEAHGFRAVGLNFRGCSEEMNRTARFYHSGETEDIGLVVDLLRERFRDRFIAAIGFSLGGNALLKLLGERGAEGRAGLAAAVAVSVPYDLAAGADALGSGFIAGFYTRYFVRSLQRKVRAKQELLADLLDLNAVAAARTLRAFDEAATAPLHGFGDADEYYRESSATGFLSRIRTPTLLLHALDDPFLPSAALPRAALHDNPHLTFVPTEHGGHVGFVQGRTPWTKGFWAESEAARFLAFQHRRAVPEAGTDA